VGPVTAADIYEASRIKRRRRATKSQVTIRRVRLFEIVEAMKPMTVRQVFYQATVRSLVEKSEAGYAKVQTDLVLMRRAGEMPYGWLVDNTRWQRKLPSYDSIEDALAETARLYRKALWTNAGVYVEVWLEKDALAGVVLPVTQRFDVPLMVARGYASLSFPHGATEYIGELDVPTYVYHLGDYDPSGINAGEKIEQTLRELAPDAEIYFQRVAVTTEQIARLSLPTRPTKDSDSRAKGFSAKSVELDAMPPATLRGIVQSALTRHMPPEQFLVLKAAERSERELLRSFKAAAQNGGFFSGGAP
jgi:hypothetical protein